MRRALTFIAASIFLLFSPLAQTAHADKFVAMLENQHDYFWQLLSAALLAADGNHTLLTYKFDDSIPQSRVLRAMLDDSAPYNVTFTGHNAEREALMHQIDIPLTRGLYGYRVFVIHKSDAPLFKNIQSLKTLTDRISVGSGSSWPDTTILKAAGFNVKTSNITTLWSMLARGRFTAFPRSVYEVGSELKNRGNMVQGTPVMLEETIMLHYPFDLFLYLPPNEKRRADILEQGLRRIYTDGTFMEIFEKDTWIKAALEQISKHNRKIITLKNPLNSERVNNIPAQYWHNFVGN